MRGQRLTAEVRAERIAEGRAIAAWRRSNSWSQAELGRRLGVSYVHINAIEAGSKPLAPARKEAMLSLGYDRAAAVLLPLPPARGHGAVAVSVSAPLYARLAAEAGRRGLSISMLVDAACVDLSSVDVAAVRTRCGRRHSQLDVVARIAFGLELRRRRVARGWSTQRLANQLGLTRDSVEARERGQFSPSPVHLEQLRALDLVEPAPAVQEAA